MSLKNKELKCQGCGETVRSVFLANDKYLCGACVAMHKDNQLRGAYQVEPAPADTEAVATFKQAICCPVCGHKPMRGWKEQWRDEGLNDDPMDWYECNQCRTHFGVAGEW